MNCLNESKLLSTWGYKPSLQVEKQAAAETVDSDYTGIFGLLSTQWAVYNSDRELILQANGNNLNLSDIGDYRYLDVAYFMSHSGGKNISPLIRCVLQLPDGTQNNALSYYGRAYISNIIRLNFSTKWNKLIAALNMEYNPIENYSMTEESDTNGTNSNNVTINGTDTLTHGLTVNDNVTSNHSEGNSSVYGFDSTTAVPVAESETDNTNNRTITNSGDDKTVTNRTDITAGQRTEKTTLKRSGNIGVTTSQQMLESEFEVRKHNILDIIFADIDSILTIPIY